MNLAKKEYNRDLIVYEVLKELSNVLRRDQFMECISIWIKFKRTKNDVPLYYDEVIKSFSNNFVNKTIIIRALSFVKKAHSIDNSLSVIKIDLKKKIDTNRIGQILIFDVSTLKEY